MLYRIAALLFAVVALSACNTEDVETTAERPEEVEVVEELVSTLTTSEGVSEETEVPEVTSDSDDQPAIDDREGPAGTPTSIVQGDQEPAPTTAPPVTTPTTQPAPTTTPTTQPSSTGC